MNILISTLKESSITDTAKLVHIYLFNHWLFNNHRETIYDKAKFPTQTAIASAIGNSQQNIKKAIEVLTQNNLLNIYEGKLYTVSVRNNDGELVELTDPTEFTKGNHALINSLGNYISIDNETFATKLLTAPIKIVYFIAKYVWMKPNGEAFKPISYYSEFAKKGFTFLTEDDLKYAIRKLTNNGFIEKELTTFKAFKGFTKLKFHTINDLAKAIEEKTNIISASIQKIQEIEEIIEQLPDGLEEIKELIKEHIKEVDTIKTQNEGIKGMSKIIQYSTDEELFTEFDKKIERSPLMNEVFEAMKEEASLARKEKKDSITELINNGFSKEEAKSIYKGKFYDPIEEAFTKEIEEIVETLTDDEVENIISKCDTQINTNKTLRSLSEGQYNYFLASLKGKDNLPITLRRYR